jgi:iron complex transport system substrate-binding protein
MRAAVLGFLVASLLATSVLAAPLGAKPAHIVSLNLCGDQYVVRLAERARIASLSPLAVDPELSAVAGEAAGLPRNRGRAEDVIMLGPDLVIAGGTTDTATLGLLRRLGIRLLQLEAANSTEAVRSQTRRVAEALGEAEKGEAWIATMDAALGTGQAGTIEPRALYWNENGFSVGQGTLMDEFFHRAGFLNAAQEAGLAGYGRIPLETLVLSPPDLLVMSAKVPNRASNARALLAHPAVKAAMAGKRQLELPAALSSCETPDSAAIVPLLVAARP